MKPSLFKNLTAFLKHPNDREEKNPTTVKIKHTLTLYSWCFTIMIFLSIALGLLLTKSGFQGTNLVEQFVQNEDFLTTILLAAIIGPALEEIIFRLPLRRETPYLAITLTTLSIIVITKFFRTIPFPVFLLTTPLFALLYKHILNNSTISKITDKIYSNYYPVIFYLISLLFGFIHIFNYTDITKGLEILPLLIIPQVITGLFLGYVRVKNGFKYSLLFHSLYNTSLLLPATIATKYADQTILIGGVGIYILAVIILAVLSFSLSLKNSQT